MRCVFGITIDNSQLNKALQNQMKNILIIILLAFSVSVFAQEKSIGCPTFEGGKIDQSVSDRLQEIKNNTQIFISKNIDKNEVQKLLRVNDTIEFNYQYVVSKSGYVKPNKTKINTSIESFNIEITKAINDLPKFSPAYAIISKKFFDFDITETPEFFVGEDYRLMPIFRKSFAKTMSINSNNELVQKICDNIKSVYFKAIKSRVYFSVDEDKKIGGVRIFTEHQEVYPFIKDYFSKLDFTKPAFYNKLIANENYSVDVHIKYGDLNNSTKNIEKKLPAVVNDSSGFTRIERVPLYKGANPKWSNSKLKMYMSEKIVKFVNKNFNANLASNFGLSGRQKILAIFKIDKLGNVVDIRVRAPHSELKKEAERVISLIPKFDAPGMQKGEPVVVPYSLPIIFQVEKGSRNYRRRNESALDKVRKLKKEEEYRNYKY